MFAGYETQTLIKGMTRGEDGRGPIKGRRRRGGGVERDTIKAMGRGWEGVLCQLGKFSNLSRRTLDTKPVLFVTENALKTHLWQCRIQKCPRVKTPGPSIRR
jgi:hypothetical protein